MSRQLGPDRECVILFLQQTERLLDSLVMQVAAGSTITAETPVRVRDAWREVRGRFASTKYWAQRNSNALGRLRRVGLAGAQLELSYRCFHEAYVAYSESSESPALRRARVLRWVDGILGSLAVALPDAAAVLGFKRTLEGLMN